MPKAERHDDRRRIHVLMFNACGGGGVARTVITLANHLARSHRVELISLYRRHDQPRFAVDPRIKVTFLHDARAADADRPGRSTRGRARLREFLGRRSTRLRPEPVETEMSLLTDV